MIGMQMITDNFLPLHLHLTIWILLNDLYFEKAPVPSWASQVAQPANTGGAGDLGWEDPLEEEMAAHSSILAWEIPQTEESHGLQSMGSQRVRHDFVTE